MFVHWTTSLSCLKSFRDSRMAYTIKSKCMAAGPCQAGQVLGFHPCTFQPHPPHRRTTPPPTASPESHHDSLPLPLYFLFPPSETPFPPLPTLTKRRSSPAPLPCSRVRDPPPGSHSPPSSLPCPGSFLRART